jgi:deoxyribodipyrimidine photo-lyase
MRELAANGWMHNRVRLVTGSFLAKDLLIPWQRGEAHFGDRLVDLDPASNAFNWQWVAGSGADASPYFRIFNPWLQGVKFDPDGTYVRTWVPELSGLPSRWIHTPWAAPAEELARAGVVLGETYPHPIVDHAESRQRALAAFEAVRAERIDARAARLD